MKIIDKHNFFGTVCEIYTILSFGKIIWEAVVQGVFGNYQENLLVMFFITGGSVCTFTVLQVSGISVVVLYCGTVCCINCTGHAGYMDCRTVSSIT